MPHQASRPQVELELGEAKGAKLGLARLGWCGGRGAPQHGAHPRQKLARAERFGQIIVRSELEPHDPIGFIAYAGQHDDRNSRLPAQCARDRHPVLARQAQVQNHEVDRRVGQDRGHFSAGLSAADTQSVLREVLGEQRADTRIIVNDEDVRLNRCRHGCHPRCRVC